MPQRSVTDRVRAALDRLRKPAYTGENRCTPCTLVNLAIAAVASLAVAVLLGPVAGVVAFALCATSIALRGYLVPGTPELTRRYFPDWLLRAFEKEPRRTAPFDPTGFDVEAVLREADAIAEKGDDLGLTPSFASALAERMAALDADDVTVSREALAELLGVDADRVDVVYHGDACTVRVDGRVVGQWESRAAFAADVAGHAVFEERYPGWDDLPVGARGQVLGALRICIDRCPLCEGAVVLEQTVVQSCCRDVDVVAATCTACGSRLFEAEVEPDQFAVPA